MTPSILRYIVELLVEIRAAQGQTRKDIVPHEIIWINIPRTSKKLGRSPTEACSSGRKLGKLWSIKSREIGERSGTAGIATIKTVA